MRTRNQHAFTLVELLIVIVIIAILAAITVVTYTGIQARARASAVSSSLSQAKKKLELYKVDNTTYPATGSLAAAGITDSNDTTYQYTATNSNTSFCLTATTATTSYYINDTTASSPTAGDCPGHGVGGNSAITNLVIDPRATSSWGKGSGTGGSTTATVIDDGRFPGGKAYKVSWTTAPTSTSSLYVRTSQNFSVIAGEQYFVSVYYAPSWSGMSPGFYFGGSPVGVAGVVSNLGGGLYREWANVTFTTNGSVTLGLLSLTSTSALPQAGDTLLVGGFMAVKGGGQYSYADGDSPNWVWNGTANASTSTGPAL